MTKVVAFKPKKEIRMWCDEAGQPVYLENVHWSDIGLRERLPSEVVHMRDEKEFACVICGEYSGVWMRDNSLHANKCHSLSNNIVRLGPHPKIWR